MELEWAAFSADGKRVVVGGLDGAWASAAVALPGSLPAKSCEPRSPGGVAVALDDGKALLIAGDGDAGGDALSRIDLTTCKPVWSVDDMAGHALAVAPDGKTALVAGSNGAMRLHGLTDGALIRLFQPTVPARRGGKADDDDDDDAVTAAGAARTRRRSGSSPTSNR